MVPDRALANPSVMAGLILFCLSAGVRSAEPEWQTKFDQAYRLADGENAKLIAPPFIAERQTYHRANHPGVGNIPGQYGFRWKDGHVRQVYWSSKPGDVASAMYMASIEKADLDGVRDLFDFNLPGDWIVRDGATRKQILADVQRIITKSTDGRIRVEPAQIEKDVIVARGKYEFKALPNPPREPKDVHLFTDKLDTEQGAGGGTGTMSEFLRRVGEVAGQKVVDEAEPHKGKVSWTNNHSANDAASSPKNRDLLLKNVAAQTSLRFDVEHRKVDVWRVTDTTGKSGGL